MIQQLAKTISLALALSLTGTAAEKRPNIVFFLADDLGWMDLACYGSQLYETPRIDQLATSGIRFTNAYATCPVCSPSRHSILSGKYPARSGCTNYGMPMKDTEFTLAEALKEQDYATYFIGKWHLGGHKNSLPTNQGFDINIAGGPQGQPPSYFSPYGKSGKGLRNLPPKKEGEYLTDRLGDEATTLITKHPNDKPFLLYFSFYSVHTPIQGRKDLVEKYQKKVDGMMFTAEADVIEGKKRMNAHQKSPAFAAMVEAIDQNVGKVIDALRQKGLSDNTIVVFTSDNGGAAYYRNATSNRPLRAAKGWLYEGGIREPLIVSWPGTIKPSENDTPVIGTDFYPTLLDLAGLAAKPEQHKDGKSFAALLRGDTTYQPRPLFWHYPHNHGSGSKAAAAIRDGDFKLIEFLAEQKPAELYNLKEDPAESNNLATKQPALAKRLQLQLDQWQESINAKPYTGKKIPQP